MALTPAQESQTWNYGVYAVAPGLTINGIATAYPLPATGNGIDTQPKAAIFEEQQLQDVADN
jgi:hypothetical protein